MTILIAGSGVAAVECALALRGHADVELLSAAAELLYRPSSVTTPFGGAPAARIDLKDLGVRHHRDAVPGAITFRGPPSAGRVERALAGAARVVFAAPPGPHWPLPLYELALQAAGRADGSQSRATGVALPHERPRESCGRTGAGAERPRRSRARAGP